MQEDCFDFQQDVSTTAWNLCKGTEKTLTLGSGILFSITFHQNESNPLAKLSTAVEEGTHLSNGSRTVLHRGQPAP